MVQKKISGLNSSSKKKKKDALEKTERAIKILTENQSKITIRAVARKAGVSVSYIYKYPELAYKIQRLKEQQNYSLVLSDRRSKDLDKEVEKLNQEKTELKLENEELKEIIERVNTGKTNIKELRAENIQLAQENVKLKKELEYTLKNLQSAREFILKQGRIGIEQPELRATTKEVRQISE